MVYDDIAKQFVPRYGYKGSNQGIDDHVIVEVKKGEDPFADPWASAKVEKKERIAKNEQKRARNIERHEVGKGRGKKGAKSTAYNPESIPGIPLEILADDQSASSKLSGKRGRAGVRQALSLVQHSTASLGRFDPQRQGEPEKKLKGRKRIFRDNNAPVDSEKSSMKQQLRIVEDKIHKKAAGVTNSLAQYEGILPDAPSESFKQKKGKGGFKSSGGGDGPPKKKYRQK